MEFTADTPPLPPNTKIVSNNQDVPLSGTIAGIAQVRVPVFGFLYIMELDENSVKYLTGLGTYSYRCVAVPECDIEVQNEIEATA